MTISRAQIPEQIDVFQNGGALDLDETNQNQQSAAELLIERLADYDANLERYQKRFETFAPKKEKLNIFDVATELGAGLLKTPNTGGISPYVGLSVGFDRISERLNNSKIRNDEARRNIGLEAAKLATQDENTAIDFIKDSYMATLAQSNKRGPLLTFEYTDANGEIVQETVRDNFANDKKIEDLLAKGAVEVKSPASQININQGQKLNKRDEKALDAQVQSEDEIFQKYRAGAASLANLDEAEKLALKLGAENFGTVSKISLYPRQLLSSLGLTDANEDEIIGNQILIGQISLGFTMDIVSRTKGAISNREMEMFERASPGLGSNYNGYLKQVEYLKRVAKRDVDFYKAYTEKAEDLEKLVDEGELSMTQLNRQLRQFEVDWYDENLIFNRVVDGELVKSNYSPPGSTEDEFGELEKITKGGYTDEDGMLYQQSTSLDVDGWRESFRKGQEQGGDLKSTYSQTKSDEVKRLETLREQVEKSDKYDAKAKEQLLLNIDNALEELRRI
jgi:hypothetical protein|tara:strand:- start:3510 stop:5030 length:1521 start_codon:yes stop_codon:yes gene_type:complete